MFPSQETGGSRIFSQPPCDLDFQGGQLFLCARKMGVGLRVGKPSLQILGANPRPLRRIHLWVRQS